LAYEMKSARVAGPVAYRSDGGIRADLPYGPCLIERIDDGRIAVIWGSNGEHSTELPLAGMVSATKRGALVLLD
jgi:hypothetical protein